MKKFTYYCASVLSVPKLKVVLLLLLELSVRLQLTANSTKYSEIWRKESFIDTKKFSCDEIQPLTVKLQFHNCSGAFLELFSTFAKQYICTIRTDNKTLWINCKSPSLTQNHE